MTLDLWPGLLAVCRLAPDAPPADWMTAGAVVCAEAAVPEAVVAERGWRALAVRGPLDFALTGVLARLAAPLAEAGVPIFVVSTYDTDVLMVQGGQLAEAVAALRAAGHEVREGPEAG